MSMKPILFSTPMVQAILDGRKTMTRRVVKPDIANQFDVCPIDGAIAYIDQATGDSHHPTAVAKYHPGDILWVRETWRKTGTIATPYAYKADEEPFVLVGESSDVMRLKYRYKPSIFMPREAARIFLRVTDVRVERLREITCGDVYFEGPPFGEHEYNFITFWDSINAKRGYGWDTNPWVWVYTFKMVEKPDSTRTVAKYATHGEFIPDKEG